MRPHETPEPTDQTTSLPIQLAITGWYIHVYPIFRQTQPYDSLDTFYWRWFSPSFSLVFTVEPTIPLLNISG